LHTVRIINHEKTHMFLGLSLECVLVNGIFLQNLKKEEITLANTNIEIIMAIIENN
jgi:hypothetical protein